ncbi:3-octaprenyl-4-hydroxybenzoate carboxy-lyase, partial [mine drainage metagenome]
MNTLAKISGGISDSLITRAAAVCLKERRKLIIVPREMPLSEIALENMLRLTRSGAIIAPSMPSFYTLPKKCGRYDKFCSIKGTRSLWDRKQSYQEVET